MTNCITFQVSLYSSSSSSIPGSLIWGQVFLLLSVTVSLIAIFRKPYSLSLSLLKLLGSFEFDSSMNFSELNSALWSAQPCGFPSGDPEIVSPWIISGLRSKLRKMPPKLEHTNWIKDKICISLSADRWFNYASLFLFPRPVVCQFCL